MGQGICKACLNDVGATTLETKAPKNKLRPLLSDLDAEFKEFAGEDGVMDCDELFSYWKAAAERKLGKLSPEDVNLLQKSTNDFFVKMDIDKGGKVTYHEFVLHMLGGAEERGPLKEMRSQINAQIARDPSKLSSLIEQFKRWDKNGDGYLTPEELEQHLEELDNVAHGSQPSPRTSQTNRSEAEREKLVKMKEEIFKEADVDHDGRVDLWEVMAHALGRRKQPVEILLYDISRGAAEKWGKVLIGKDVAAVHSGVLVYGSEYWYGGKVFKTAPPCSKCFGAPLAHPWNTELPHSEFNGSLPVVKAGYTFVTQKEFAAWMQKSGLVGRYTGLEKYDLLTHSCNHFSNEVVTFLTGEGLPSRILELQKMALTPGVQALRPFLNKYLGGFGEAGREVDQNYLTKESAHPDLDIKHSKSCDHISDILQAGEVVLVSGIQDEPVLATVLKEADGIFEVKYFDPSTNDITVATGVKQSQISKTAP